MGTGVTLVDHLDGLAGGVAALALAGLSVASLPICSGNLPFWLVELISNILILNHE
jgi:UDP-N-acetylmuramyl pentapeptide phosphotransferase/UDP-N-acetylglucosamine-1-phosphate transferase